MAAEAMAVGSANVVWTTATGFACLIRSYDDTRYQVRLAWQGGTVKSDLYDSYPQARSAALAWKTEVEAKERFRS
jgi:hypothetical protein